MTADGLKHCESKVQAIRGAPQPVDVAQLRFFNGLMNYYGKFLPNLSSILSPLYHLFQKSSPWIWEKSNETPSKWRKIC